MSTTVNCSFIISDTGRRFMTSKLPLFLWSELPGPQQLRRDFRATFYVYDRQQTEESPVRKQAFAKFLFEHVDDLKIDGFNHRNPKMGLSVT